jgi:hypothetical protein
MSQFFVPGPVYTFVGLGAGSTIASPNYLFLGFTEAGLSIGINPLNEDINVDYAGLSPGDVSQLGQDASVSGTFTRYDEQVALKVQSFMGVNGTAGQYLNNQMGNLMVKEGSAYSILTYFPYSVKTEFNTMVPGYNFFAGYINNPVQFTASIRRKAPEFNFRCIPVFGTFNGSTFQPDTAPYNASILYNNVMPNPLPNVT